MDIILAYVLLLAVLEGFEAWWQKDSTLGGMIQKAHAIYSKNIFIFFLMHPGLYLLLFIALLTANTSLWILFPIFIKATDIIFKISIMQKLEEDNLSSEYKLILSQQIPQYMFIIPIILYPTLLYFALTF
ncbi:MAG: hypothetical protein ACQESH_08125 [Campylobacterota bacterium]